MSVTLFPSPALADAILVLVWLALALDGVVQTRRVRAGRAALGPVLRRVGRGSIVVGVVAAGVALAAAAVVEHRAGRLAFRPPLALVGLGLALGGLLLHGWARRTLGPLWSGVVEIRARHTVVATGPYARVRHPIYAALLLLAAGTLLAHPSVATLALACGFGAGLLVKLRLEERALRAQLGDAYARYAARVPALIPLPVRDSPVSDR